MACFVATVALRLTPPSCMARRSSGRRPGARRGKRSKSRLAPSLDPILDDNGIDTTDITTFVSCPTCFNSLMIRPQQLVRGPIIVTCNCCFRKVEAAMEMLENMDGTTFDQEAWQISQDKIPKLDARDLFSGGER